MTTQQRRQLGFAIVFVVFAAGVGACSAARGHDDSKSLKAATARPVSETVETTSTTTIAPTTTVPPTTVAPPVETASPVTVPVATDPHIGLLSLGYRPTPRDAGRVVALFQTAVGLPVTGEIDAETHAAIDQGRTPPLGVPEGAATRIEVDLAAQRLVALVDGKVVLVTYISSGTGSTPTLRGNFTVYAHTPGFQKVQKGRTQVFEPLWYDDNYGIHGYHSVPNGRASSGCVRIPDWVAEELAARTGVGTRVYIY